MKLNKKGMEMSVNALVGIIIGLALFGTAMTIFFNIYNEASSAPGQVDDRMRQEIINRFDASQRVFVPTTSQTLDRSSGDATFHIAVRNLDDEEGEFEIEVDTNEASGVEAIYLDTKEPIGPGDTYIFPVLINGIEMDEDQVSLTIKVFKDGDDYGNNQVIRVNR